MQNALYTRQLLFEELLQRQNPKHNQDEQKNNS